MAALRLILDTNVLVSGLAYPSSIPGRVLALWRQGAVEVVLSRYILNEVERVQRVITEPAIHLKPKRSTVWRERADRIIRR